MDIVFKAGKAFFNYRVAGIWIKNDHVLLHKFIDDNFWALPGGRVSVSEESKISIKREFREELNVNIEIDRLVFVVENFFNYEEKDFHEIGFYYTVKSSENSIVFDGNPFYGVEGERLVYKWTPIDELENVELSPKFLREAIHSLPQNVEHLVVNQ